MIDDVFNMTEIKRKMYRRIDLSEKLRAQVQKETPLSYKQCPECLDPIQCVFPCKNIRMCARKFCSLHRYIHDLCPQDKCDVCDNHFSFADFPFEVLECQYNHPCDKLVCQKHFKHYHENPLNYCAVCKQDLVMINVVHCNYTHPCNKSMCNGCQSYHNHQNSPYYFELNKCSFCTQEKRILSFCQICKRQQCSACVSHTHSLALETADVEEECGICYNDTNQKTPCKHFFHQKCIDDWSHYCDQTLKALTCPKCRKIL